MIRNTILIEIFSKPDCHLCEVAKEVIKDMKGEFEMDIRETNIEENEELLQKHRYDIPVVMINGRKAFKHRVDPDQLRKRLTRESRS